MKVRATDEGRIGSDDADPIGSCFPDDLDFVRRAAACDEPVLLMGETGVGKSHLARLIHRCNARSRRPLVCINCGSIPESLFEREMFGHERGAFTDARQGAPGLFEAAENGTLLLDEIGELPLGLQVKLLDVLESGNIRRIGSTRSVRADVRLIGATNSDLVRQVQAGRFREDLFHRLAVVCYTVPPLRKRGPHILDLATAVVRSDPAMTSLDLSSEVIDTIVHYPWPGNVRELLNALRHARVFCDEKWIQVRHLPEHIQAHGANTSLDRGVAPRYRAPLTVEVERHALQDALQRTGGNRALAARLLGMSRSTLWLKMKIHAVGVEQQAIVRC